MKDSILALVERSAFRDLTSSEQAMVLAVMTAAEYDDQHESLKKSRQLLQADQFEQSEALQAQLTARFRAKHRKDRALKRSIDQRVPAWVAIAASVCIGIMSWLFSRQDGFGASIPQTIYVHEIDTIYKEIEKALDNNDLLAFDSSHFFQQKQKVATSATKNKVGNVHLKTVSATNDAARTGQLPNARVREQFLPEKVGQSVQDDTLLSSLGGRIF